MTDFSSLTAGMDNIVFNVLADSVTVNGTPIRGMYSAAWRQPDIGTLRTGMVEPVVVVQAADAAGLQLGAVVVCQGVRHTLISVEPDGAGLVALVLREIAA